MPQIVKVQEDIKLYVRSNVMEMLRAYTYHAEGEYTIMAYVTRDPSRNAFIVDELLPLQDQECTGSDCELTDAACLEMGRIADARGRPTHLRCWIHSHSNHAVFFSGTDETNIKKFKYLDYLVSIVVNKKNEIRGRVDIFQPFHITVDDLEIRELQSREIYERAKEEISAKVKNRIRAMLATHLAAWEGHGSFFSKEGEKLGWKPSTTEGQEAKEEKKGLPEGLVNLVKVPHSPNPEPWLCRLLKQHKLPEDLTLEDFVGSERFCKAINLPFLHALRGYQTPEMLRSKWWGEGSAPWGDFDPTTIVWEDAKPGQQVQTHTPSGNTPQGAFQYSHQQYERHYPARGKHLG